MSTVKISTHGKSRGGEIVIQKTINFFFRKNCSSIDIRLILKLVNIEVVGMEKVGSTSGQKKTNDVSMTSDTK